MDNFFVVSFLFACRTDQKVIAHQFLTQSEGHPCLSQGEQEATIPSSAPSWTPSSHFPETLGNKAQIQVFKDPEWAGDGHRTEEPTDRLNANALETVIGAMRYVTYTRDNKSIVADGLMKHLTEQVFARVKARICRRYAGGIKLQQE